MKKLIGLSREEINEVFNEFSKLLQCVADKIEDIEEFIK